MRCDCDPLWTLSDCSARICVDDCSVNGLCLNGLCHCSRGFTGPSCKQACSATGGLECSGRGQCVNSTCFCLPGWSGHACDWKVCKQDCSAHGVARATLPGGLSRRHASRTCVCARALPHTTSTRGRFRFLHFPLHHPSLLEHCVRALPLSGRCHNGDCRCDSGFRGPQCSIPAAPTGCACATGCVRSCLKTCTAIYETEGAQVCARCACRDVE